MAKKPTQNNKLSPNSWWADGSLSSLYLGNVDFVFDTEFSTDSVNEL